VLRLAATREGLDDNHAAAAARTWTRQHAGLVERGCRCLGCYWARRHGEQLARVRHAGGAVAAGEKAIVSDAMEAFWQYVDQKAPDELAVASVMVL
jgi:hypothetical protein